MALQTRTLDEWTTFFKNAGIPETESATYATKFVENRLTELSMSEITKDMLIQLEITVLGDQLSILKFVKPTNENLLTPATQATKPKPQSGKLPSIETDMTHPQFRKCLVDWDVYKNMTLIPADKLTSHIYNSCSDSVQSTLVNVTPKFLELDEATLLKTIEKNVFETIKSCCSSNE